jgi:hypothetical protein
MPPGWYDKMGEIDHLIIDKVSGRVGYAVMSFGGFLNLGHRASEPASYRRIERTRRSGGQLRQLLSAGSRV